MSKRDGGDCHSERNYELTIYVAGITSQQIAELLNNHGGGLVLLARQWCGDPDDALQEALVELTKQSTVPDDPVAWLFIATKRRALNQARSDVRRVHRQTTSAQQSSNAIWFECDLEKQEEAKRLQECLERLDPLERQILVSRIWGNLSFSQIAETVESSSSSVHRHYQAAIEKMRKMLGNAVFSKHESSSSRSTRK